MRCAQSLSSFKISVKACNEFNLELLSIGYDPYTLKDVPSNPKKIRGDDKEMPKLGRLSLEITYQTSGTQINLDYL